MTPRPVQRYGHAIFAVAVMLQWACRRKPMKMTLLAAALLAPLAAAAAPVALVPASGSAVWIEGDSTLHPWSSTSTAVSLEMTLDRDQSESLSAAAKGQKPAKLVLKVPV